MKNIGKLAVLGAVLAASASAFAATIQLGSYGTGTPNMGNANSAMNYAGFTVGGYTGTLSSFTQDPTAFIEALINPSVNIGAGAPWANALTNSSWVSYTAGTNPASGPSVVAPEGYYTFTTTFSVAAPGMYNILLNVLADDSTAIFLHPGIGSDSELLSAGPLGNDGACSQFGINCETPSVESFNVALGTTNTLIFVVEQTGFADFGLDFNGSVTPVGATPEPSSLMLLGTGLVGAAGMMFRRRRTV